MSARDFELVLVGGGLQSGLIVLGVLHQNSRRRVALVEAGPDVGGNHTWCMHPHDVPERARAWVDPLFVQRWPAYEVRFPERARTLPAPYVAITSPRFAEAVRAAIARSAGSAIYLGRRATHVGAHAVELDDGTTLGAELVVDARGPDRAAASSSCGFQKFLGIEVVLAGPHGLAHPIVMDATVAQEGGFRFVYTLPLAADRLLVEDTSFSRSPELSPQSSRALLLDYAARFAPVTGIAREETGVLPMPWASAPLPPRRSPLVAGYRGGWFHPATGYSLPPAIRLACHLSERRAEDVFDERLRRMYRRHRAQVRFAQRLNRMLFHCFAPEDAWNVFARFYTLPDDVIHRFYALSLTAMDRARLLVGRPPRGFSLARALTFARMS